MEIADVNSAFAYIESFSNLEKNAALYKREYRLDRMKFLLKSFNNPEKKINIIHIAGSKGKGSCAAFCASALNGLGFKTGLYTSPHILSYTERITVSGESLNGYCYIKQINRIKTFLEKIDISSVPGLMAPTTFELLTLLALLIFEAENCSYAVLETGLGGRLDATNTVNPVLCMITAIELEHTEILGDTIDKIAYEKAGIIKKNIPVFCHNGDGAKIIETVIRTKADSLSAPCFFPLKNAEIIHEKIFKSGTKAVLKLNSKERVKLKIKAFGSHQVLNAGLVIEALWYYFNNCTDFKIKKAVLIKKTAQAEIKARFEKISKNPDIIIDGAHTPESVRTLLETWKKIYKNKKAILLFASVEGKKTDQMAGLLAPHFSGIIITTPGWFKPCSPEKVIESFKIFTSVPTLIADPGEAYEAAVSAAGKNPILICGSFYLLGEIKKYLLKKMQRLI